MTIFDATIFDIVRVALRADFFHWISTFGKQERVPLEKFSNHSSFESFRDEMIEEQLKPKYLRDLLSILDKAGVPCVVQGTEYGFGHLVELVMRRNIHIHNRGRIDAKYLEMNVYNLALGDVAPIDADYWRIANWLCRNCVIMVAAWADALP